MEPERKIYSVAEVNRKARMVLESAMGELWVEGELSRVTLHSSGHWYFTLKDESAAVSCAMFRNDNAHVMFKPKDGLKVQMLSRPSLYEANGRYQLIASEMEEAGKGNLQEQFEKLKAKLAAEGLFDDSRKKPLPVLPRKIGVVTSPTGAAIRDIINVLTRRFPNLGILLAPVVVQGPTAANSIASAIRYLNKVGQASRLPENERDAHSTFFNPHLPLDIHERNLPHWTQEGVTYFVTFRLADSIPQSKLEQWKSDRELWLKTHEEPYGDEEKNEYHRLFSEKIMDWLDAGMGSCVLEQPKVSALVADAFRKFDGERYDLGEWVVMPNHVHVLLTPKNGHELKDILHSWKSFVAHEICKAEGTDGQVWQHESYDHIVRSPEQLLHFERYIHENPAKAGIKVAQASERSASVPLASEKKENKRDACSTLPIDIMIVGRGGGSIEDLWAFNEEVVARAIAESEIPVISAVGHEIDFTIADFVADVRAPTPSAAAELAVREKATFEDELALYERRLRQSLKTLLQDFRLRFNRVAHSYVFREPENLLLRHRRQIQSLEAQMGSQLRFGIRQAQQCIDELGMVMHHQMERKIGIDRQSLVRLQSQLRMLNPLAVLGRGYSLTRKPDGTVVRSSVDVDVGEKITTQLADGKVVSNVLEKE